MLPLQTGWRWIALELSVDGDNEADMRLPPTSHYRCGDDVQTVQPPGTRGSVCQQSQRFSPGAKTVQPRATSGSLYRRVLSSKNASVAGDERLGVRKSLLLGTLAPEQVHVPPVRQDNARPLANGMLSESSLRRADLARSGVAVFTFRRRQCRQCCCCRCGCCCCYPSYPAPLFSRPRQVRRRTISPSKASIPSSCYPNEATIFSPVTTLQSWVPERRESPGR